MPRRIHLSQAELRELLDYDPQTGAFVWLPRVDAPKFNGRLAGKRAGTLVGGGVPRQPHIQIVVERRFYSANRLAWLHHHGPFDPTYDVEAIDGDFTNCAIANLRLTSQSDSRFNVRIPRARLLPRGVRHTQRGTRRYEAYLNINGVYFHLGVFNTAEEADASRKQALALAKYNRKVADVFSALHQLKA